MKKYLITILTSSDLDILKLTIDSALGQIYKNYDLYIVVNTINNEYYSKVVNFCNKNYDDKITKILETPSNGKPGKGHNSLLKIFNETDYEYLVICDGDDFLYPTALTRIDDLINKNNYDTIVFCGNSSSIKFSEYSCTEKMCLKSKSYEFKQTIKINKHIFDWIHEDYNSILQTPCRIFCLNKNIISNNLNLYDEEMFIYDDYKAFLNIYNGYITNEYNVCFLSDPYCYLYNNSNYNSVSVNQQKEEKMNDLKLYQNYDISNLDVRNIKIKVNKELPSEQLIAVINFERLITNQYKQYCNKVNYSKIPFNNNFCDINNIMFLDNGTSWNYNTINEKSLRGTENAIYQLSMHLSHLKFNNIIVLTKDGIQKQINDKLYYDNIQNFKNYNANIIVHQGIPIPTINNLSEYSEKKHILYIQHDVIVSCIKNTYSKIHLFDKYIYKYIFVSNWQKNRYIRYYGLNNDKCVVVQNAINPIINLNLSLKKTKSLIFVSSPYMGVINVLPLFNTLLEYIPDLKLKIFSSFNIENTIDNNFNPLNMEFLDNLELDSKDKYYLNYYKEFIKHDNIEYYGSVPQKILFKHFNDSMILLYPCVFPETCCTSILEAMAHRCFVVSSDLGALQETSNNMAYLFDSCLDVNHINFTVDESIFKPIGIDKFSKNYVKMFLEKTIDLVNNYYEPDKQQYLNKQQDFINNNCKWDNKVEQFMEFIK